MKFSKITLIAFAVMVSFATSGVKASEDFNRALERTNGADTVHRGNQELNQQVIALDFPTLDTNFSSPIEGARARIAVGGESSLQEKFDELKRSFDDLTIDNEEQAEEIMRLTNSNTRFYNAACLSTTIASFAVSFLVLLYIK